MRCPELRRVLLPVVGPGRPPPGLHAASSTLSLLSSAGTTASAHAGTGTRPDGTGALASNSKAGPGWTTASWPASALAGQRLGGGPDFWPVRLRCGLDRLPPGKRPVTAEGSTGLRHRLASDAMATATGPATADGTRSTGSTNACAAAAVPAVTPKNRAEAHTGARGGHRLSRGSRRD